MLNQSITFESYQSKQSQWEKRASIRSRPRRVLPEESDGTYFFPVARQPLCLHSKILKMGEIAKQYLLVQSLFKYMNDIANIETDVINHTAMKIFKDQFSVRFPESIKQDALSIVIDETYHAYVALDFMKQVSDKTGIQSLELPKETELSLAIREIRSKLPESLRDSFELIAVAIAEHVLTHDLIGVTQSDEVSKTFYAVMGDHVIDEGRHSSIFASILEYFWNSLDSESKEIISVWLPTLLDKYLKLEIQIDFEKNILRELAFTNEEINEVIDDTYKKPLDFSLKKSNPIVRQILLLLKRTKVTEHPATRQAFINHGFLD